MDDAINAGDPSDRVFAWWVLDGDRAIAAADRALPAIESSHGDACVRIATPEDIVALRQRSPDEAAAWRMRVREEFLEALAAGFRVIGLDEDGSYVLTKGQ